GRGPDGTGRPRRKVGPVRCRVCARALQDAAERKIGRCLDCPSDVDEFLFEQLREWRLGRAREQSQPAFVIFTDATLTAIAETRPLNERQLAAIPGVSRTKLERFGDDVLALCAGHDLAFEPAPDEVGHIPEDEDAPDGV
ncbi:HRDC domain-containing protein, partial [Embleya sp. NPDC005575]|uniref:HRDC domain-containing protein n=1 Tax=Embleya sp. NPDC005575 TaxID=3156892 RepID=UPI0033A06747